MTPLVREGYASARAVARHHAKSFHFASVALFGARRRAAFALYAFCRRLDDLVDECAPGDVRQRLDTARVLVAHLFRAPPGIGPREREAGPWSAAELAAFEDTVRRFKIPEQPFQDLITGMEMDLSLRRYASWAELDLYCYRVAGTVGLMLTPVLGFRSDAALGPAADLGRAMQLTNILRDIHQDLRRGRCYLPQDELAAHDLSEAALWAQSATPAFSAFMRFQIARARELYARAAEGIPFLTGFGSQRMVRMMGAIYAGILNAIEQRGYDVFRARAYVPTSRKLAIALRVLFSASTPSPRLLSTGEAA